ncbi:MAG: PQQ-binding-like beta-propeller repeat protein [Candidatus Hydrogenedentes bacterium]|nr:PQQ-binding-like beta-propeller repeat protein [Candidatus Hydrogenedentota bacterium]
MKVLPALLSGLLFLGVSYTAHGTDWPHWRGPLHNGSTDEKGLPSQIDPSKDVLWSAPMPGQSSATPIVSGDAVFVVSNDETQQKVVGFCLDRATGAVRWQKVLCEMAVVKTRNNMASCSPVTDGKTSYFLCGAGALFAFDWAGNELWKKDLRAAYGPISQQFGFSSSPLLLEGKLYVPLLHGQWETGSGRSSFTDENSFLICLDAATGAEVWKHHRRTDARGESLDSYASAVPFQSRGVPALLVQGGDHLSAHQLSDGAELWRHTHNAGKATNWRLIPSPVVAGDLAIGIEPRGGDVFAVLSGEKKELAYDEAHWILQGPTSDVPSPAIYNGRMYIVTGTKGDLICVDPNTGQKLWEGDLEPSGRIWASPTVAEDKIYCLDENGQVTIASVGDALRVLSQTDFPSSVCKSTIAIAGGQLFVRTSEMLYCLVGPKG